MLLDTRPLIVDQNGIHLRPSAVAADISICGFCSFRNNGCVLPVQRDRCSSFAPPLSFVDETGLQDSFSTWRASSIWADRANHIHQTNGRCSLIKTTGEHIGYARVTSVVRGPFSEVIAEHAHTNHLVKGLGLSKEDSADWLKKWIVRHMGSRFVKEPHRINTVIYLERE